MTPSYTLDPRDQWSRARRLELFRYAKELGHTKDDYITEHLPAMVMVKLLKARNVPPPSVPQRPIGAHISARSGDTSPTSHHHTARPQAAPQEVVEVDAADVLERDWKQQAPQTMNITELRKECKRRGIKMVRTDNMTTLKAKLDGQ